MDKMAPHLEIVKLYIVFITIFPHLRIGVICRPLSTMVGAPWHKPRFVGFLIYFFFFFERKLAHLLNEASNRSTCLLSSRWLKQKIITDISLCGQTVVEWCQFLIAVLACRLTWPKRWRRNKKKVKNKKVKLYLWLHHSACWHMAPRQWESPIRRYQRRTHQPVIQQN